MEDTEDFLRTRAMGFKGPIPLSIANAINSRIERTELILSISAMLGVDPDVVGEKTKYKETKKLYAIKYKVAVGEIKNINRI